MTGNSAIGNMRDMSTIRQKLYTAIEAAQILGLTDGRIRQVCRWNSIGTKIGAAWLLTDADMKRIGKLENRKRIINVS